MLHMVSAWAIEGCIVTIDAIGCQKKIAEQISNQKADYVLAVKENQKTLYDSLCKTFKQAKTLQFQNMVYDQCEEVDAGHGRLEEAKRLSEASGANLILLDTLKPNLNKFYEKHGAQVVCEGSLFSHPTDVLTIKI